MPHQWHRVNYINLTTPHPPSPVPVTPPLQFPRPSRALRPPPSPFFQPFRFLPPSSLLSHPFPFSVPPHSPLLSRLFAPTHSPLRSSLSAPPRPHSFQSCFSPFPLHLPFFAASPLLHPRPPSPPSPPPLQPFRSPHPPHFLPAVSLLPAHPFVPAFPFLPVHLLSSRSAPPLHLSFCTSSLLLPLFLFSTAVPLLSLSPLLYSLFRSSPRSHSFQPFRFFQLHPSFPPLRSPLSPSFPPFRYSPNSSFFSTFPLLPASRMFVSSIQGFGCMFVSSIEGLGCTQAPVLMTPICIRDPILVTQTYSRAHGWHIHASKPQY